MIPSVHYDFYNMHAGVVRRLKEIILEMAAERIRPDIAVTA